MSRPLIFKAGNKKTSADGIFEGYEVKEHQIKANVSVDLAEDILRFFISAHEEPLDFTLTIPADPAIKLEFDFTKEKTPRNIYRLEWCLREDAFAILNQYGKLLLNDGLVSFSFWGFQSCDKITFDQYNVLSLELYSQTPEQYEKILSSYGIEKTERLITAANTFRKVNPGVSELYTEDGISIYALPDLLKMVCEHHEEMEIPEKGEESLYTGSVDEETIFLRELSQSCQQKQEDGKRVIVRTCPKCHKGIVYTQYHEDNGFWGVEHRCTFCGERFILNRMETNLFLHRPFLTGTELLAGIHIKINGELSPYRLHIEEFAPFEHYRKGITIHFIYIDLTNCKPGDIITCEVEGGGLVCDEVAERTILCSQEKDGKIQILCGHSPKKAVLGPYCYRPVQVTDTGLEYKIVADPGSFDRQYYRSWFLPITMAIIGKGSFDSPAIEVRYILKMAIKEFIGY